MMKRNYVRQSRIVCFKEDPFDRDAHGRATIMYEALLLMECMHTKPVMNIRIKFFVTCIILSFRIYQTREKINVL